MRPALLHRADRRQVRARLCYRQYHLQASQILAFAAAAAVVAILDPHKTLGVDALAGFYNLSESLAAPYARSLHGSAHTVGLLMAAVPLGTVIGAFLLGRVAAPSARIRMMGWPAILSLWMLAGAGAAYQSAVAAAFVHAPHPATRTHPFGMAQPDLCAVQGLGILANGAVAQAIGAPLAVGPGGPDRVHRAHQELEPPARWADPGAAGRGWRRRAPRNAVC